MSLKSEPPSPQKAFHWKVINLEERNICKTLPAQKEGRRIRTRHCHSRLNRSMRHAATVHVIEFTWRKSYPFSLRFRDTVLKSFLTQTHFSPVLTFSSVLLPFSGTNDSQVGLSKEWEESMSLKAECDSELMRPSRLQSLFSPPQNSPVRITREMISSPLSI